MTPWFYILGFGIVAWFILFLGSSIKLGAASTTLNWICGVSAVALALTAGTWATRTWISDLTGWVIGWGWVAQLALFAIALVLVGLTVFALMHDRISSAIAVTPPLTLAWVLVPSLLQHGAIPGSVGRNVASAVGMISARLIAQTQGWFG